MNYAIVKDYLPAPTRRRPGVALNPGVRFLVAHDTGNAGSSARANVHYYQSTASEESASAHIFVDDKEIVECIPALTNPPEKAWHVRYSQQHDNHLFGVEANDAAIGVEYCFGGAIDADEAYKRYVWTLAALAVKFELNPATHVVGHYFLDPERRTDPITGLARSRRTFEQLLRDVTSSFENLGGLIPTSNGEALRARRQWVTSASVRVRAGLPSTSSAVARILKAGTTVSVASVVNKGEAVAGNSIWLDIGNHEYVWSGAFA